MLTWCRLGLLSFLVAFFVLACAPETVKWEYSADGDLEGMILLQFLRGPDVAVTCHHTRSKSEPSFTVDLPRPPQSEPVKIDYVEEWTTKSESIVAGETLSVSWNAWSTKPERIEVRGEDAAMLAKAITEANTGTLTVEFPEEPDLTADYRVGGLGDALKENWMTCLEGEALASYPEPEYSEDWMEVTEISFVDCFYDAYENGIAKAAIEEYSRVAFDAYFFDCKPERPNRPYEKVADYVECIKQAQALWRSGYEGLNRHAIFVIERDMEVHYPKMLCWPANELRDLPDADEFIPDS